MTLALERSAELIDVSGDWLDLPSAPTVRAAAKAALDAGETHYTTRPGINPLREAIAAKLANENGINIDPLAEVLVTCGGQEALFVALNVLLSKGDQALLVGPQSVRHAAIIALAGGEPTPVAADLDAGLTVDPARAAAQLSDRARMLIVETPSYAGSTIDEATLGELAKLAVERELVVVALEGLEPFVHDGARHVSIGSLPGMAERTVTINGFSAAYGLRGWRVGYMAGPRALLQPITQLKQALTICTTAVSQYAALAAVANRHEIVPAAQRAVAERRARALAALEDAGISHLRPSGGMHVMLDARGHAGGAAAALHAAAEDGVRLASGSDIGVPDWLRLSLTRPPEVVEEAIARLVRILGKEGETHG